MMEGSARHAIRLLAALLVAGCGSAEIIGAPETEDAPPDRPDCEPGTGLGECNVVEQCGCPSNQWCWWGIDLGTRRLFESCYFTPPGDRDVGQRCNVFEEGPPCRPGTDCMFVDDLSGLGTCYEWCRDDEDCSRRGASCTLRMDARTVGGPSGDFEYPYMACSQE